MGFAESYKTLGKVSIGRLIAVKGHPLGVNLASLAQTNMYLARFPVTHGHTHAHTHTHSYTNYHKHSDTQRDIHTMFS